jgi:catechol 2,3-dioxygenase-like lactoylglutathione lyase family enzyme
MAGPLRLQSITLTAPDAPSVARFYRWVLQLKAAPERVEPCAQELGWGNEDRVRVVAAGSGDEAEEAVTLRMPAMRIEGVGEWCAARGIEPAGVAVSPADVEAARERWSEVPIAVIADEAARNRTHLVVRGPAGERLELVFPLPKEVLIPRRQMGPFYWRSRDWHGLEVPGLLGVTSGAPDVATMREFLSRLGIGPLDEDGGPAGPLGLGEHQWVVEGRERPGIYGFAVVVQATRINDLRRTLERLEADYRQDGNRLLAADPTGRFILVNGVHAS